MADQTVNIKLSTAIRDFMGSAVKVIGKNPAASKFLIQAASNQKKAAKKRSENEKLGLQVPPYMIVSITNRCNLNCKGCYSKAQHRPVENEIKSDRLRTLFEEASTLGISFIFLAGGEPLMRPDVLELTKDFPEVLFPLFTNGLLITDTVVERLRKQKNIIPVVSLEGYANETDFRRGNGVFERLQSNLRKMKDAGVLFGLSFTVTRSNFATLTDETFINTLIGAGASLFFFVEYVPVNEEEAEVLAVTQEQRTALSAVLDGFRNKLPGLFVSFPGDEEAFGGCLSAGRGFIHVSAEGALEPCPFAPYSDANLNELSLKEALKSDLLRKIRENHSQLTETKGGCALWDKRDWVKSIL